MNPNMSIGRSGVGAGLETLAVLDWRKEFLKE
jgi:hypothetical protein